MSVVLVLLAILVVGATVFFAIGRRPTGDAGVQDRQPGVLRGLVEPTPSLPAVLLPDDPTAEDVRHIRFSLGLRGYRMDQVDEVLDSLSAALKERDALIEKLRAEQDAL